MRKSLVALLVVVALIVLISPGIVGRLAEKSMDDNLDWAAQESQELVVTSQGFDRGWFSSTGRHRVELHDGRLRSVLIAVAGADASAELPALIIDTQLDHGLIPVTSMTRETGTLAPGLGNAVSTLSIELADGAIIALPGTIYSSVGLTGELSSNYVLEPGTHSTDNVNATWGAVDIDVTTNPVSGAVSFAGLLDSYEMAGNAEIVRVEKIEFKGQQSPAPFGFAVGDISMSAQEIAFQARNADNSQAFGPLSFESTTSVDGERVTGQAQIMLEGASAPEIGDVALRLNVTLMDADGRSIGNITRTLENIDPDMQPDRLFALLDDDLRRLLAAGMELRFDQLDVTLPQGPITSKMRFSVAETDSASFTWTSVLLALDAWADISIAAELVEFAVTMNPQANAAIGMGFLRRNGDFYEMQAAYKKGLLTVNGAPMPIPLPAVQ